MTVEERLALWLDVESAFAATWEVQVDVAWPEEAEP